MLLRRGYLPEPYGGRVVCFRAVGVDPDFPIADYSYRWRRVADAQEGSMLTQPHAAVLGTEMATVLAEIDAAVRRRGNRELA